MKHLFNSIHSLLKDLGNVDEADLADEITLLSTDAMRKELKSTLTDLNTLDDKELRVRIKGMIKNL